MYLCPKFLRTRMNINKMGMKNILASFALLLAATVAHADGIRDSIKALPAHRAMANIIVTGRDSLVRAFEPFSEIYANGAVYARAMNHYAD